FLAGDSELVFERLSGWELTPAAAIRLIGDPLVMRRIRPDMLCGMADLALSAVEAASGVDVPVLTMVGARDELVRLDCVRRLFESRMAAATCVFQSLAAGDHILASRVMYWALRDWLAQESRLDVSFVEMSDLNAISRALAPDRTKLVWLETPANPLWSITDIE